MAKTASSNEPKPPRALRWAWRGLAAFWALVMLCGAGLVGTLAWLGPLTPDTPSAHEAAVAAQAPMPRTAEAARPPPISPHAGVQPVKAEGGIIAPPDATLLEPAVDIAGGQLPHVAADGRAPMQVYAAGFDRTDQRPRVALLIAGVGMNQAESELAIANLPAAVSLAVSPYGARLDDQLAHARHAGHELLVSLPLEPQAYPINDPGHHALLTGASLAVNGQRLDWALTRFGGYVGATGALGAMRGERFAAASDQMEPVLTTLAQRGLLYVDPRPNARRPGWQNGASGPYRGVDLVIDDQAGQEAVDAALARLEVIALNRGSAIGLIGRPAPLVVDRVGVWLLGLESHGLALAPVSVVVQMPQAPTSTIHASLSPRGPP